MSAISHSYMRRRDSRIPRSSQLLPAQTAANRKSCLKNMMEGEDQFQCFHLNPICTSQHGPAHLHTQTRIHTHIHAYTSQHRSAHLHTQTCIHTHTYTRIHISAWTCPVTHTSTHTHSHTHAHLSMGLPTYTYTNISYTHTNTCTHISAWACPFTHRNMHTHTHTQFSFKCGFFFLFVKIRED